MNIPFHRTDYEKILQFIAHIQEARHDFRHHVLMGLSSFFSYDHTTFFLINSKARLVEPVGRNIQDGMFNLYDRHYYKTDIFHPLNVPPEYPFSKNSLSITDIMPLDRYRETEYYNDFLKPQNLFYEIGLFLKYGNRLIGALGVFRPKEEGNFTQKDLWLLDKLAVHISHSLYFNQEKNRLINERQFAMHIISEMPTGLVLLDKDFNVVKTNETARTYCRDIANDSFGEDQVQQVINKVLAKAVYSELDSSSRVYVDLDSFIFKIVPALLPDKTQGIQAYYYIYITKRSIQEQGNMEQIAANYNLTEREIEIVKLVALGLNNKEIADSLFISSNTVRTHLDNIRRKLGVKNRTAILHKLGSVRV